VNTGITGVNVYVDNEFGGTTDSYWGCTVNGLTEGTYTLKLIDTGYKNWTKKVSITSGKTTTVYAYPEPGKGVSVTRNETLSYDALYGTLQVNTGITGVNVYVDNEYGGLTDSYWGVTVKGLIEGAYTLKLTSTGYKNWTKQIIITYGKTTSVNAYLEAGKGVSVTRNETLSFDSLYGTLQVDTGISGVSVYVGNLYFEVEYDWLYDLVRASEHHL
jgi:phospholipase C